jgi:phosphoribosylglycinamide formyltransferase-1
MPPGARIGLFSTLTGPGSRALVEAVAGAWRAGALPGAEIAFLFVNREPGESEETDAAVEEIATRYGLPVVRASAVRFRPAERKAARAAEAVGDPEPLWAWREAFYESYRDRLPETDLDVLLGDMWIWSHRQCAARRGVNLHPSLPSGPLGKIWYDVVWDLVAADAEESGVMLHRVTPEVDLGPVVSYGRYPLRGPRLDPLWAALPDDLAERAALIERERRRRRDSDHPLFRALRSAGLAREVPLVLATMAAVAGGRLRLEGRGVVDGAGRPLREGLDLSPEVEARVAAERTPLEQGTGEEPA